MKFQVFVNPKRPKIPIEKIVQRVQGSGLTYSQSDADIVIVVGGDGTFGYYGRILDTPMLFVGVREPNILGSKAKLAQAIYNYDFEKVLHNISKGNYNILEKSMLSISVNGRPESEVLTDVYLERSRFAGCIRYIISISRFAGNRRDISSLPFKEYAIGNGIIVSTSFGSTVYFSYPNWFKSKKLKERQNNNTPLFSDNKLGLCHIIPNFLIREKDKEQNITRIAQYTIPISSKVKIKLIRDANCRLYGTTKDSNGIPIRIKDTITISQSENKAKIIKPMK